MGEMVASRCRQVLEDLKVKDEDAWEQIKDEVDELLLELEKIEKLLNNDDNSIKVKENMRKIRNVVYTIEDTLEIWAVLVEEVFMPSKNEKKRGITRFLRRCFGRGDEGTLGFFYMMLVSVMKSNRLKTLIKWFHDTFPDEVVLKSDTDTDIDRQAKKFMECRSLAHRRSLRLPRPMYAHGMEGNYFEREEDLKALVDLVAHQDKEHQVVSIWGAKGLGKTNLARRVYIHSTVRTDFKAFAWVPLSKDYQIDDLLQNILNQLDAGAVKRSAEAVGKSAEEKKDLVAEEQEIGAHEKKEGAEKSGSRFQIKKKKGAEAVTKSAADHKKEGVEAKKEGAEEQPKSSEETMMDRLEEILRKKRCFIVIDDVSESSQWKDISSKLPMDCLLTKFLLTTENEMIATDVGFGYKLSSLTEDQCWELLQKYAFRGKKAPDLGLIPKLGKEIVRNCGCRLSDISIIGTTLSEMSSSSNEWHKVNERLKVKDDVVAEYLPGKADQSESKVVPISNYDGLSYRGKQCFLYLAIFKEDEGVDLEDLSFLWMADGMLEKRTTENYLLELKSMLHVQVDELSTNRMFISLPNHAREFSLQQGEREDLGLKVVDFSGGKQPRFDQYSLSDGIRRLVIHFNKLSSPGELDLEATYGLRSLLFLNSDREYVYLPVTISDFSEFTLLRILHFVRCKFGDRKLPQGIDKLFNLRYLGVLYCDLEGLPPSISNVRNLRVLNVRSYDDSKIVIPNVISQMARLKHVRLPRNSDHEQSERLKLNGLHDLETLDGLNADIHDLGSLSKLEKLRDLSTHAYSNGSLESIIKFVKNRGAEIRTNLLIEHQCDFTSQEGMTVLEEVLMSNLNALTFSMVVMPMFPNCGQFASKRLTQMKLIGCKLSQDPMEALGKFPNLGELSLGYGAFVGKTIAIGDDGGFPNLQYLEFRCLPNLEKWRVHKEAMKKLSTLIVRKCPKLKGIPDELMASVSSLNNMEIELPLTALAQGWEEIYKKKFGLVKSHSSGSLKDMSVAVVFTKQVDQKNKLPAGTDTGAAGAGTSGWGGVDDTGSSSHGS